MKLLILWLNGVFMFVMGKLKVFDHILVIGTIIMIRKLLKIVFRIIKINQPATHLTLALPKMDKHY